jgi:hypothetical protein
VEGVAIGWSYLYLMSRGWSYLYLVGTTPNEGAKLERREDEGWIIEPRGLGKGVALYRWRG